LEAHLQDTHIRLACEINSKIDLRDLDIQMELFFTSLQRIQLSPILINTQAFLIFSFILPSISYVWLQNEILNCKFSTTVLKEHLFFPNFINFCPLLGAFAKLQKASSYVSAFCPHGTTRLTLNGFSLNVIFEHFPKYVENIQDLLKLDNNNECFIWRPIHILEWEIFQTKVAEKIKTHILCSVFF